MTDTALLTSIIFAPALGALIVSFCNPRAEGTMRSVANAFSLLTLVLTVFAWQRFDSSIADMQMLVELPWIKTWNVNYKLGIDGISLPLVLLTGLVSFLALLASTSITKAVKGYLVLFLLLETGMLGVFLALDFFLFYVFWEVMLLPMYFLIGVWGGPRREYAAIKFFLYTLLGSVLMLIAILMLYFNSDLVALAEGSPVKPGTAAWEQLHLTPEVTARVQAEAGKAAGEARKVIHTFNIQALAAIGQNTTQFDGKALLGKSVQWWAFILLFIGFAVKVPSVPVHTWLPDAHVEAPTPISMILAGVLLKMGGYGIIRICYPICPDAGYDLAWFVCTLGVVSMVYGAFAALAQKDFKRLVAYSSVSHMGYVVLGIGVWSVGAGNDYNTAYWSQGWNGAMFQMIAHGISSAGMFFMVGVVYDRVHHRNLDEFGGLFARMPVYSGMAYAIFFAGLGLPGLCGFIGEVFVTLSAWNFSHTLAVISAAVVILTAAYILWTLQRVYLGAEYRGPHEDHLHDVDARELAIAAPLVALAIFFGVYPTAILNYVTPSVDRNIDQLAGWTERVKTPRLVAAEAAEEAAEEKGHAAAESKRPAAKPAAESPAAEKTVAAPSSPAAEQLTGN